jgi:hypothetical protein
MQIEGRINTSWTLMAEGEMQAMDKMTPTGSQAGQDTRHGLQDYNRRKFALRGVLKITLQTSRSFYTSLDDR